jgi:hypothetical protein
MLTFFLFNLINKLSLTFTLLTPTLFFKPIHLIWAQNRLRRFLDQHRLTFFLFNLINKLELTFTLLTPTLFFKPIHLIWAQNRLRRFLDQHRWIHPYSCRPYSKAASHKLVLVLIPCYYRPFSKAVSHKRLLETK